MDDMKLPPLRIGAVCAPDSRQTYTLFSNSEANAKFNAINHDIYQSKQTIKYEDNYKTPSIIKWLASGIGIAGVLAAVRKFVK